MLLNNDLAAIVIGSTLIVASFMGAFYAGFQRGWRAAWTDMQKSATSTSAEIPPFNASGNIPPMFKEATFHDDETSRRS